MSNKLEELPELGDVALSPRQNPNFVPDANFTTEDYFVWSRCDGVASIKQILQALGMGKQKSIEILARLREQGAISIGDETTSVSAEGTNGSIASPVSLSSSVNSAVAEKSSSEKASKEANAENETKSEAGLSNSQQNRIRSMIDVLDNQNLFDFLGVAAEANKRDVKRAYFRISKEFHPDRFYGKALGEYEGQLSRIFETATKAYAMFSDERKRRAYLERVIGDGSKSSARAQTKEEHGEDLYKRACDLEIRGKQEEALRHFSAAVKSDGKASYYKRAAMCALRADSLKLAEEFAKESVERQSHDPSALRVLSDVYRSGGRLEEAESALEKALRLNSANDKLMGEIEKELRELKSTRSTTNVEGG